MKKIAIAMLAVALLAAPSLCEDAATKEADKPWLDLENCSMCKSMGEHMDMMAECTWENHKIENGCMSASVVPEKHQAKMAEVHEKMMAVGKRLEQGEKMPLCGYCVGYGELKMAGARIEEVKTDFGMVALVTSDDPELVKKIHAHTDKTIAAYKAMTGQ